MDDSLEAVLLGGPEHREIVIADHDPAWADRFASLAAAVRGALGTAVLGLEHVGSTSVPGLAAKPIVDALLLVRSVED